MGNNNNFLGQAVGAYVTLAVVDDLFYRTRRRARRNRLRRRYRDDIGLFGY